MKYKPAGQAGDGAPLVYCPVCGEVYRKDAINHHFSQMAGKEAQYKMADIFYNGRTNLLGRFLSASRSEVMKACPHWQYILNNPRVYKSTKPVAKK